MNYRLYLSILCLAASVLSGAEKVKTEKNTVPEVKAPVVKNAVPAVKDAASETKDRMPEVKNPALPGMTSEPVSIAAGEKRVITLPFVIESCRSNSSNVKINHASGTSFELSGVTPGRAVVTVVAGGLEKQFNVTVFNSTLQTYQELGRLLDELPEITMELHDSGLILRGVVTSPGHWRYFRRIMPPYAGRCTDYVMFRPDGRLIEDLKKQFAAIGIPVAEKSGLDSPGKVSFQSRDNVLVVSGDLYSDADIKKVQQLLSSQEWLNPEWNKGNFRAETDLTVAPSQIDLGIVFVGLTRTQLERIGNASADGKVLSWDVIGWFKALYGGTLDLPTDKGEHHHGGSVILQSSLKGSLLFFGNNGVTDFRDAGHITLTNNSKTDTEFENGGTRSVKVYGRDTADLKEINFGLKYTAKALLLNENMVRLELDLERSLPPVRDGDDYLQRKSKTKTSFICPLGKTAVIAGQKELTFSRGGPSGYAFLRHIPVVNWFTSFQEDTGEQMQILILVSPERMKQDVQVAVHPSEENRHLEKEVSTRTGEKEQKVRNRENHSWFLRMFDW